MARVSMVACCVSGVVGLCCFGWPSVVRCLLPLLAVLERLLKSSCVKHFRNCVGGVGVGR